jgi:hypothetical protein
MDGTCTSYKSIHDRQLRLNWEREAQQQIEKERKYQDQVAKIKKEYEEVRPYTQDYDPSPLTKGQKIYEENMQPQNNFLQRLKHWWYSK